MAGSGSKESFTYIRNFLREEKDENRASQAQTEFKKLLKFESQQITQPTVKKIDPAKEWNEEQRKEFPCLFALILEANEKRATNSMHVLIEMKTLMDKRKAASMQTESQESFTYIRNFLREEKDEKRASQAQTEFKKLLKFESQQIIQPVDKKIDPEKEWNEEQMKDFPCLFALILEADKKRVANSRHFLTEMKTLMDKRKAALMQMEIQESNGQETAASSTSALKELLFLDKVKEIGELRDKALKEYEDLVKKEDAAPTDISKASEEQTDLSTIFHEPSLSSFTTLRPKAQALSVEDWDSCLNKSHGPAKWKCINCEDYFCDDCKDTHMEGRKSRWHRLLSINEREKEDAVRREVFCTLHENKELDMYCITDKMAICTLCTRSATHRDHETEALDTYADRIRSRVGLAVTNADRIFPKYEERIENLSLELLNAEVMSTMNQQHIKSSMQEAIAKIRQNAAELLDEDERKFSFFTKSVTTEVDDLRSRKKEAKSRIRESRRFLESCLDQDLIKQAEVYIGELDTIKEPERKSDSDSIVHEMTGDEIQSGLCADLFSE